MNCEQLFDTIERTFTPKYVSRVTRRSVRYRKALTPVSARPISSFWI
jgi:hypothetical protein